jgi:ubiquinol-cytochrome c reductase cytochrome b subunit
MRLIKNTYFSEGHKHISSYPTPNNLNYTWSFGFLSGVFLTIQIVTGLFLSMHYTPHADHAFISVENIVRHVPGGWFFKYTHANGASFFFIVVYAHMARSLYYQAFSNDKKWVWIVGVLIFIVMMATAFLGYVLPWGQMSYWGATVITNLFAAIPYVGKSFTDWLWGGYSVSNPTLYRFCCLHYLLPLLIVGLVALHILLLHRVGSTNPSHIIHGVDNTKFFPYFVSKDLFIVFPVMFIFTYFVFFEPNYLGHPDNYIMANPKVTPAHIVPEWYFLIFYAILRSVPNKLAGVCAMFSSIIVLFFLPLIRTGITRTPELKPLSCIFWSIFVTNCFLLTWLGAQPVAWPYLTLSRICTVVYFTYFLVALPVACFIERKSCECTGS